ncbi:MAG: hypothetical protein ACRENP_23650 [Longimicrobiales bacterium]
MKDPTVIAEFKRRRARQLLASGLAIIVIVPMFFGGPGRDGVGGMSESTFLTLAMVLLAGAAIYSLINWRCPACTRYLGRSINPAFCAKCGAQLRE